MQGYEICYYRSRNICRKLQISQRGLSVEPEGHLRISNDKNKPRYYQCIDNNNEIYIPRSNKELSKLLAQSTYNRTVLKK